MCQKDHGFQKLITTNLCGDLRVDRETTMSKGSSTLLTPSGEGERLPCGAAGDAIGECFGTDYSRLNFWRRTRPRPAMAP